MHSSSCEPFLMDMISQIEQARQTLAERVKIEMPESGFLETKLNQEFEDESKQLDIRYWWFSIHTDLLKKNPNVRYLSLAGFLGGGYKIDTILHHGSNAEISEWLKDKKNLDVILNTMKRHLEWCND